MRPSKRRLSVAAVRGSLSARDLRRPDLGRTAQATAVETQCLDDVQTTFKDLLASTGKTTLMTTNPLSRDDWKAQLASIVPGKHVTGAPIFIAQGLNDSTVLPFTTDTLVHRICGPDRVKYKTYADTGHADSIASASTEIVSFVRDRLAGVAFVPSC